MVGTNREISNKRRGPFLETTKFQRALILIERFLFRARLSCDSFSSEKYVSRKTWEEKKETGKIM